MSFVFSIAYESWVLLFIVMLTVFFFYTRTIDWVYWVFLLFDNPKTEEKHGRLLSNSVLSIIKGGMVNSGIIFHWIL